MGAVGCYFFRCQPFLQCHYKLTAGFIFTAHTDDAKAARQQICFTLITSQQHGNQGISMIIPKLILYNEKYSHNPKLLWKGSVYFKLSLQLIGAAEHTALWR